MNRHVLCIMMAILSVSARGMAAEPTPPTVSWTAQVEGTAKHYQYVLTNTALLGDGSPALIQVFMIEMTDVGARLITGHGEPSGWTNGRRILPGYAKVGWYTSIPLQQGDSATFDIYTSASTPTAYSWNARPINWLWNDNGGDSFLPVPIPEPSSILVLASGLGALGLRRRRC